MPASWSSIQYNLLENRHIESFHLMKKQFCFLPTILINLLEENKTVFLLNIVYFSVCLTSNKLYWIEDQLADVSVSWRWQVEPLAT